MPLAQVCAQGLPELQEKELLEMICTWFGMCWPGNPLFISVKVLHETSRSNRGKIANGTMSVRFATQELAEHFLKIADGLEVLYLQYDRYPQLTRDGLQADMDAPPIARYHPRGVHVQERQVHQRVRWRVAVESLRR